MHLRAKLSHFISVEQHPQAYQFNTKKLDHRFCTNCGSSIGEWSVKNATDPGVGMNVSRLELLQNRHDPQLRLDPLL
jgi:hypothetical protein